MPNKSFKCTSIYWNLEESKNSAPAIYGPQKYRLNWRVFFEDITYEKTRKEDKEGYEKVTDDRQEFWKDYFLFFPSEFPNPHPYVIVRRTKISTVPDRIPLYAEAFKSLYDTPVETKTLSFYLYKYSLSTSIRNSILPCNQFPF
jgi:hypothetical protein